MAAVNPRRRYLVTETLVSVAINAVLSAIFTGLLFGRRESIAATGPGGFAIDFVVQAAIIGLMSALIPTLLARARLKSGRLGLGVDRVEPLIALTLRAIAAAIVAGLLLGGLAAGASWSASPVALAWLLVVKVAFGGAVAALVTPLALARLLGRTV